MPRYAARDGASARQLSSKTVILLGITGGIVPCPTATIIVLLGIGANVIAGALYAVAVFSLGMALTLMVIGFLALSSRRFATRIMSGETEGEELTGPAQTILLRIVPTVSGLAVVTLGAIIAANYAWRMQTGVPLVPWLG